MSIKKNKGFTLIELLVVIAIISLLSSVVLASLNSARDKAKVAQVVSDLGQINLALNLYFSDNGKYPCFDPSWNDAFEKSWADPYLKWPTSPWGDGWYHWEHWGVNDPNYPGVHYSISIHSPGQANAEALDKSMDDNNLSTGIIRGGPGRVEYGGMDQTDVGHCGV